MLSPLTKCTREELFHSHVTAIYLSSRRLVRIYEHIGQFVKTIEYLCERVRDGKRIASLLPIVKWNKVTLSFVSQFYRFYLQRSKNGMTEKGEKTKKKTMKCREIRINPFNWPFPLTIHFTCFKFYPIHFCQSKTRSPPSSCLILVFCAIFHFYCLYQPTHTHTRTCVRKYIAFALWLLFLILAILIKF